MYLQLIGGNPNIATIETIKTDGILSNQWVEGGELISNVASARVVEYNNEIFVIGGKDASGTQTDNVQIINVITGEINSIDSLRMAYSAYDTADIVYQGVIYSFGGQVGNQEYLDLWQSVNIDIASSCPALYVEVTDANGNFDADEFDGIYTFVEDRTQFNRPIWELPQDPDGKNLKYSQKSTLGA